MHKPLVYNSQHKRHPLIASRASAERTCYCGVGSKRQGSGGRRQLDVWAVCGVLRIQFLQVPLEPQEPLGTSSRTSVDPIMTDGSSSDNHDLKLISLVVVVSLVSFRKTFQDLKDELVIMTETPPLFKLLLLWSKV